MTVSDLLHSSTEDGIFGHPTRDSLDIVVTASNLPNNDCAKVQGKSGLCVQRERESRPNE